MAVDTTVLEFEKADANQYRANRGIESGLRNSFKIQVAKRSNVDVSDTGTLYWRDLGVLTTVPKFNDAIEVFEAVTGGISKVLGTVDTGRKVDIPVMYQYATALGKAFASKSYLVPTFASSPVATDIDDTLGTSCTIFEIKVTAVTGFVVGSEIEVMTGTDALPEYARIKAIDATNKILHLETPICQLPEDAATVKQLTGWQEDITVNSDAFDYVFRTVENIHTSKQVKIVAFEGQHKAISTPDGKEGKTAEEMGFTLNVQAKPVLSGQTQVLKDLLYRRYTLNS